MSGSQFPRIGGLQPEGDEQEIATLPGPEPGTALRVCLESTPDGAVRLEQLAHSRTVGWYVQKSFCIPADLLPALVPQLRKADCLRPRRPVRGVSSGPLRLGTTADGLPAAWLKR